MATFVKQDDGTYQEVFGNVKPWENSRDDCLRAARDFDRKANRETSPRMKEQYEQHAAQCRRNADQMQEGIDETAMSNLRLAHHQAREYERSTCEGRVRATRCQLYRRLRREHGRKAGPVRKSSRLHPGHDDGYRLDPTAWQRVRDGLAVYDRTVMVQPEADEATDEAAMRAAGITAVRAHTAGIIVSIGGQEKLISSAEAQAAATQEDIGDGLVHIYRAVLRAAGRAELIVNWVAADRLAAEHYPAEHGTARQRGQDV